MRVLIVDDEPAVARVVARLVQALVERVDVVESGEAALGAARATPYDLILLDWELPGHSGLDVVQTLRAEGRTTPIIMITARTDEHDVAAALDAGADDYVAKPVSPLVLRARVQAVLRRTTPGTDADPQEVLRVGSLTLDPRTQQAGGAAGALALTAKEHALLAALMQEPGAVVPRARLLRTIWGQADTAVTNVLDVALSRLRQKVADHAPDIELRSVRGLGVVLHAKPPRPAKM